MPQGSLCFCCCLFSFVVPLAAIEKGYRHQAIPCAAEGGSSGILNGICMGLRGETGFLDTFRASGSETAWGQGRRREGGGDDSHDIYVWQDNVGSGACVRR